MAKIPCEYDQSSDIANYIGGGVRFKAFSKRINQAFSSDTTYTFSLSDFGFDGITPKGFAMLSILGLNAIDYDGVLGYSQYGGNKPIFYRCKVSNPSWCQFTGIVFY